MNYIQTKHAFEMGKRALATELSKWLQSQDDELFCAGDVVPTLTAKLRELTFDWSPPLPLSRLCACGKKIDGQNDDGELLCHDCHLAQTPDEHYSPLSKIDKEG